MHQHATDAKYFGGVEQAQTYIADERATDTLVLIGLVNSQSAEHGNWDRIRHVASKSAGCFWQLQRTRSKRVVGNNAVSFANHKGTRRATYLICTGSPMQPIIQFRNAGIEFSQLMVVSRAVLEIDRRHSEKQLPKLKGITG